MIPDYSDSDFGRLWIQTIPTLTPVDSMTPDYSDFGRLRPRLRTTPNPDGSDSELSNFWQLRTTPDDFDFGQFCLRTPHDFDPGQFPLRLRMTPTLTPNYSDSDPDFRRLQLWMNSDSGRFRIMLIVKCIPEVFYCDSFSKEKETEQQYKITVNKKSLIAPINYLIKRFFNTDCFIFSFLQVNNLTHYSIS